MRATVRDLGSLPYGVRTPREAIISTTVPAAIRFGAINRAHCVSQMLPIIKIALTNFQLVYSVLAQVKVLRPR